MQKQAPTFKAAGSVGSLLGMFGSSMQWIEDKGFLASFLIQDSLGMTAPRVGAAFLRDKEVTGQYNIQEGFEVLGREGLTGPSMMAVAPIMMAIAARFGKTTSVNSQLIRRFGNSLKEIVSKPEFNQTLLENKEKFKEEFYNVNIRKMLANTLGKDNVSEDSVKYILEQLMKYDKAPVAENGAKKLSKSKHKAQCISNIIEHINNIKYSTSSDLEMLDKLKVGSEHLNDIKAFSTKDSLEAMIKYSDEAIELNKHLKQLNEAAAEDIKDKAIARRFLTNISTMAATLGVLSILPKIYARNSIAPGARTAMQLKEQNNQIEIEEDTDSIKNGEISFKAAKSNNPSALAKFGKYLSEHTNEKFSSELEYNGHNFTNSLMAGLSVFGLLTPRGMRAYNRAQVDENGKKDLTELYEIFIRDLTSSIAVVFAVPMLTRAFVTSYENKSGFVLMHKDRNKSKLATSLDLLNPYSQSHVLKNSEIESLYHGIDSKEKMLNFCKYIDNNNGDLQKILAKSDSVNEIFNDNTLKLDSIANLSKKDKNNRLISFFEKLGEDGSIEKKDIDEKIAKLMKGTKKLPKGNKILSFARGLNSIPGFIATFLISPYLLGWFIPRLTYANTRRLHEKAEQEKQAAKNTINTSV